MSKQEETRGRKAVLDDEAVLIIAGLAKTYSLRAVSRMTREGLDEDSTRVALDWLCSSEHGREMSADDIEDTLFRFNQCLAPASPSTVQRVAAGSYSSRRG